jgi:hypothetical protein
VRPDVPPGGVGEQIVEQPQQAPDALAFVAGEVGVVDDVELVGGGDGRERPQLVAGEWLGGAGEAVAEGDDPVAEPRSVPWSASRAPTRRRWAPSVPPGWSVVSAPRSISRSRPGGVMGSPAVPMSDGAGGAVSRRCRRGG